jgi:alpha-tubulin suppressor-like RCC1 family protein
MMTNDLVRLMLRAVLIPGAVACDTTGPSTGAHDGYSTPVEVAPAVRFTEVGAGWFHTCATGTDAVVYCWGKNETGELGGPASSTICSDPFLGDLPCTGTPQRVINAPALRSLSGSLVHTCGLAEDGTAWCWGLHGFLGDGSSAESAPGSGPCWVQPGSGLTCRASAAQVVGPARFTALHVSIENSGTCAVAEDGTAWCWTLGGPASMGIGTNKVPTALPTALQFERMLIQGLFGCGLVGGEAWCWGSNWYGTLGTGTTSETGSPTPVRAIGGHSYTELAATLSSMCGLRSDGAAVCWGHLPSLHGHQTYRYGGTPTPAGGPAFVSIYGGGNHHCGLTAAGVAWCWGSNSSGFLGDGSRRDREEPVRVNAPAGVAFRQLALGGVHTCGLATDGRLFCWGHNGLGQVGRPPAYPGRG